MAYLYSVKIADGILMSWKAPGFSMRKGQTLFISHLLVNASTMAIPISGQTYSLGHH
jgi:hypothetical protein